MPLSNYDSLFGGKPGAAAEALAAMKKEYGQKKGEQVFYAKVNRLRSARKRTTPPRASSLSR
jgi:hypothetical protein